jgi:hypothetical protein
MPLPSKLKLPNLCSLLEHFFMIDNSNLCDLFLNISAQLKTPNPRYCIPSEKKIIILKKKTLLIGI